MPSLAFSLQWPAACQEGTDCFVQNYVDHDTSTTAKDFTCGTHSYDAHNGTDIRLRNLAAMRAGVAVLAPADGRVMRVRDGVPDASIRAADGSITENDALKRGQDCGNGVVIQHAEGFETMFCHMRQGSVQVKPGQDIKAGDAIGLIGLSGRTEFPHVHMVLRHQNVVWDPFTGGPADADCSAEAKPLWSPAHAFQPTALLNDAITTTLPSVQQLRDTPASLDKVPRQAPMLIYWVDIMGTQTGDHIALRIIDPTGAAIAETTQTMEKNSASYSMYVGKRTTQGPLTPGLHTARITLERAGHVILQSQRNFVVN